MSPYLDYTESVSPCHLLLSIAIRFLNTCLRPYVFFFREMYRVTEGLQREKQSLMKQLDLLRCDDTFQPVKMYLSNLTSVLNFSPER